MNIKDTHTRIRYKKIMLILGIMLGIWLMMHILALVGFLLIFLYWILWLLRHAMVPCLCPMLCRNKEYCTWCEVKVIPYLPHWPTHTKSVFKNSLLILGASIISMLFVFVEYRILGLNSVLFRHAHVEQSEIAFSGPSEDGEYYIGEIISMPILIENLHTTINAVQADFGYEPKSFEVLDILTEESFANIFIEKQINNEKGYARISGGLPNPGFSAKRGVFGTVLLKTKRSGVLSVYYLPTSMILANDGKPTNLLNNVNTVSFSVKNETIPQQKMDEQNKKYQKNTNLSEANSGDGKYVYYSQGNVLGASTSQELERASKKIQNDNKGSLIQRYDRTVLHIWLGRLFPNI